MTVTCRKLVCVLVSVLFGACALEGSESEPVDVAVQREALGLSRDCRDTFDNVYSQPNRLPPYNQGRRGDIVRCASGRTIGIEELAQTLTTLGFVGISADTAVQLFRITYRTERLGQKPDISSALVVLPVRRQASGEVAVDVEAQGGSGRGRRAPLVVFGHGTVPYGANCGYSHFDPARDMFDRELGSLLAFATHGFPVIMPDYPGFVVGSQVAGYMLSDDEGRALLDATRAMAKLLQDPPERVALVGHSQGGHAVLSAQALARSYGLAGQLVGVAAMAPFWAVGRAFGAIVSPEFGFNTQDNPGELAFAIEYFYTHAELYDGPGKGAELFVPSARGALRDLVSTCDFAATPRPLGHTAADFMQANFLAAVSSCGVYGGSQCDGGLAGKWEARFRADRPKLDARGAPIVMWHGAVDPVINPPLAKCAIDKISSDLSGRNSTARFTFCGDAAADHESILSNDVAWVTRWIEARAFGGVEPAACPGLEAIDNGPEPLTCLTPPGSVD